MAYPTAGWVGSSEASWAAARPGVVVPMPAYPPARNGPSMPNPRCPTKPTTAAVMARATTAPAITGSWPRSSRKNAGPDSRPTVYTYSARPSAETPAGTAAAMSSSSAPTKRPTNRTPAAPSRTGPKRTMPSSAPSVITANTATHGLSAKNCHTGRASPTSKIPPLSGVRIFEGGGGRHPGSGGHVSQTPGGTWDGRPRPRVSE